MYPQQIKQQWLVATRLFVGLIDGDELDWRFKKDFARVEELGNERNCGLLVIPSAIVADDVLVCSMGVVLFLNTQAVLSAVVEERSWALQWGTRFEIKASDRKRPHPEFILTN